MTKRLTAEFLGTFFLVFVGTGSAVISSYVGILDTFGHIGVALAFGIILAVLIAGLGKISGAHFNAAVTVGVFLNKGIKAKEMVAYIATQIVAAIVASSVLRLLFGNVINLGTAQPIGEWYQAFTMEFIMTFLLVFTIMAVAVFGKGSTAFSAASIGGALFLGILIAGPISGAALNPSRALGPAIVSGTFSHLWIYMIAPVLGAIAAAFAAKFIFEGSTEENK